MNDQAILANEEFLAMLAHELRNPLAPIANAIKVIEHCTNGNALAKNSTEVLQRQLSHMKDVINDLMDIVKIAKNEMQLNKKRLEICSLTKETIEECRPALNSRHHKIEFHSPNQDVWVIGDEPRIKQIIRSILNNAVKFTENAGKISVTINYGDGRVMINILDNGIGIPPEAMSKIFNLFSQPNHTRHLAQGGGLGIGLMLAKNLATLHEGTIEAYSNGIGNGSEFSIILPLEEVTETEYSNGEEVALKRNFRRLEILVVDDHPDTVESTSIILKMWGHDVRFCHSGIAAIKMAKIYQPDVALLDIGLPGCDGYKVAEKLREEFPDILLIAISGYGQKVDFKKSNNAGFDFHLVKPVEIDKLKEALATKSEVDSYRIQI